MSGRLRYASFEWMLAPLHPHPALHNFAYSCCGILPPLQ